MEQEQRDAEDEEVDGWEDSQYFASYGHFALQKSMLEDVRRNRAFRLAIESSCEDKVVLDVGCGTGLLSLFAARAKAKRVYAVERSDMAYHAHKIVQSNSMEHCVFVTQQKAEELELGEKADVLVSEWLGSFAFFESMVESVIIARDRLLKENGIMLPSRITLLGAPVFWNDADALFWSNVEGFDFSHIHRQLSELRRNRPVHNIPVAADALQDTEAKIAGSLLFYFFVSSCFKFVLVATEFDMHVLKVSDLELIEAKMEFKTAKKVNGFCVWFDAGLNFLINCVKIVLFCSFNNFCLGFEPWSHENLDTSPKCSPTHWNQELLLLGDQIDVGADEMLKVHLRIERNEYWRRHYCLRVNWEIVHAESGSVRKSSDHIFYHHRFPSKARNK